MPKLDSVEVQALAKIVEESTRSTRESAKFFIEPAPGTLSRAKNRRHHIIYIWSARLRKIELVGESHKRSNYQPNANCIRRS